ncbi:small GTP-binding protein [Nitrosococcus halophilus Nc 4]|uniref:Elongation factor G n=1 Tax=Nitrosococcus halophilus (strain Nc4) TaxID=472759 RepID=D5C225_NITHN|nr:elongation factor G [Nitrosococcus halophilus]ADE16613.1 small GTP-binding protein [Nitrosococcus halophilus Nc 4]
MAAYRTEDIRNIALVGHSACGKTTLVEALLYQSGIRSTLGSVEKGDTVSDFDPQEQRHQHSLNASLIGLDYQGCHINLIDTPGDPDLVGRTLSVLPAVETVAMVINAQSGIETMTRRLMEQVISHRMACILILNKIDTAPAHLQTGLEEIQTLVGPECLPINLPAEGASRIIDCFNRDSGETDFFSVAKAHTALLDQVVEVDEAMMEHYLEKGSITAEQLHAPFETALREGHLIPVCFTSARTGAGIQELLDIFVNLAPNPREGTPHIFVKGYGETTQRLLALPEADKPVLAHVFKVEYDPFVGKMGTMRIHRGTIRKGHQLLIDEGEKAFKVSHLFRLQGKEHLEMAEAIPGDICAVAKVEDLHLDAILHGSHEEDEVHAEPMDYPIPLAGLALEPQSRSDQQKVSDVLHKLVAEDPCLRIEHDIAANETVLRGLGEYHLRMVLEKMDDRYHVRVATHPPSIPYRETITRAAQGHHRHKKQTGGAGQFGEVFLEVEPLARGAGFEFMNKVTGGAIPSQFIPAVEKGVRQALESGAIAGYPLQDLRVTVTDGKYHPVDSKEIAFIIAGRKAFLDAVIKAAPIVLEPLVNLEVAAPNSNMGDITGDLAARRARINQTTPHADGQVVIIAQAPLAELSDYASRLKSLTGGAGAYSMEFSHYEPTLANAQKELVARYRAG